MVCCRKYTRRELEVTPGGRGHQEQREARVDNFISVLLHFRDHHADIRDRVGHRFDSDLTDICGQSGSSAYPGGAAGARPTTGKELLSSARMLSLSLGCLSLRCVLAPGAQIDGAQLTG